MSKLVAFLVAAAGASTVSVGGTFLLKSQVTSKGNGNPDSTGSSNTQTQNGAQPSDQAKKPLFESLDDFKNAKGGRCTKDVFQKEIELTNITGATELGKDNPSDSNYFGSTPSTEADAIQGCLIVDWKKDEYGNDKKWKGTFTWTWAFKNGNKGFINFNVAKSNDTAQQLDLTGGFYLLEKGTGQDKWEVKHKKEVDNAQSKNITSSNFNNNFPKSKIEPTETKDYWGFLESADKMSTMCSSSDCQDTGSMANSDKRWVWKLSTTGTNESVDKWCEKLDWWSHIYGSDNFKLDSHLDKFKGNWTVATDK